LLAATCCIHSLIALTMLQFLKEILGSIPRKTKPPVKPNSAFLTYQCSAFMKSALQQWNSSLHYSKAHVKFHYVEIDKSIYRGCKYLRDQIPSSSNSESQSMIIQCVSQKCSD
jgi:hypothetical protein